MAKGTIHVEDFGIVYTARDGGERRDGARYLSESGATKTARRAVERHEVESARVVGNDDGRTVAEVRRAFNVGVYVTKPLTYPAYDALFTGER